MNFNCAFFVLLFGVSIIAGDNQAKNEPKVESSIKSAIQTKGKDKDSSIKNAVQPRAETMDTLAPRKTIQPRMDCDYCNTGQYFMIKHLKSGLVFDAKGGNLEQVRIQIATKSMTQLWSLKAIGFGKFLIINRATGKVLDIRNESGAGSDIITYPKHCRRNQQWTINHNTGQIAGIYDNLVIEVKEENCGRGSGLRANTWKKRQTSQVFTFVPV